MQTLTDIRIYTGAMRREGDDLHATDVKLVSNEWVYINANDESTNIVRVPAGAVCECEPQPIPEPTPQCDNSGTNVLATLLRGADGNEIIGGYFSSDGSLYLTMSDGSEVFAGKIDLSNYYTKKEVDGKKLPNPSGLNYSFNGTSSTYDGSMSKYLPSIYAPSSAGKKGQILSSNGAGEPVWVDAPSLSGVEVKWEDVQNKPTTIKGFGITDAYTKREVDNNIASLEDYVNDELNKKVGKTDTINANMVSELADAATGVAKTAPIIANRIPQLRADAFAFLQADEFTVEQAFDGETWETLDSNYHMLRRLFTQENFNTGVEISPSSGSWAVGSKIRITMYPKSARNIHVDFIAINMYCNGRAFDISGEYCAKNDDAPVWQNMLRTTSVNVNNVVYLQYNNKFGFAAYSRWGIRLTFTITKNTEYTSRILGISGFGSQVSELSSSVSTAPYTLGTLWYWDYLKNVYFPNNIYEGGKSLSEKYAGKSDVGALASVVQDKANTSYVNDFFVRKEEAIDFAKDLTGVLEATPEEFTFRPSAGSKSIRDESAVIRRIKGNTSVWAQHADNPIFANGTSKWNRINTTLSIDTDGSLKVKHDTDGSQGFSQIFDDRHIPSGHKILVVIDYKRSASTSKELFVYLRKESHTGFDIGRITVSSASRRTDGVIITTTEPSVSINIYPFIGGAVEDYTNVYSVNIFDLTAIFGAGNEPTTLDGFKETYPESYYPYCVPEVRSMRTTGIETIGANAFNKDSVVGGLINADGTVTSNDIYSVAKVEVIPNEKYTLTRVANGANTTYTYALYDSEDRFISVGEIKNSVTKPISVSGDVNIPMNARYIRVVVHNDSLDSCCVNLKHSGTLTAEEAVYFKEVRMLPDIAKYFPDGMHSIGGVFDEINEESAIKRFGVVDLGTLEWTTYTLNGLQYWWATIGDIKMLGIEYFPNIACSKLSAQTLSNVFTGRFDNSIAPHNSLPRVYARSSAYTDAASFKAAMTGVMLVYELAEPIVTPITEPLQLDYKVADFGTEKMLHDLPSSPFRADIVYQFNAEGRIRDNARNIERLELHTKDMATMEDVINAIPTEVATATQKSESLGTSGDTSISPNIMYEYYAGLGQFSSFVLPTLFTPSGDYDYVWMLRLPSIATSSILSYPYTIKWKDGVAPTFSEPCSLEIYLKKANTGEILGEWKIYR